MEIINEPVSNFIFNSLSLSLPLSHFFLFIIFKLNVVKKKPTRKKSQKKEF